MFHIAIIGAGFIGHYLYESLHNKYECICTVRSPESQKFLKINNIPSIIFDSKNPLPSAEALFDKDILVISVAPSNGATYEKTYLSVANWIKANIDSFRNLKKIIVISSTSVYEENQGNFVDENSSLEKKDPKAKCLIETENTYLSLQNTNRKIVIFRLSEIYGYERSLKSKLESKMLRSSNNWANLIHVQDIIKAITFAIEQPIEGIFNLSSDESITRNKFYEKLANKYSLSLPETSLFASSHLSKNKRIDSRKIKRLGLILEHPTVEL